MGGGDQDKHEDDAAARWGCAIVVVLAIGLFIGTCVIR